MAEEFQAGICGGSWWNHPAKTMFMGGGGSSPCSTVNNISDVGTYSYASSWMTGMMDLKARSCKDQSINNNISSVSESSNMAFQSSHKTQQQVDSSDSGGSGSGGGSSLLIDSTLQMMGFGVSSSSLSSSDWNHQEFVRGSGRADDQSYNFMLQDEMNSGLNSSQVQKDWNSKRFSSTGGEESSMTSFKAINQDFSLDQQGLNPINTSTCNATANCSGLSAASYGYPSTVIQGLFEEPDPSQTPQLQSLLNHQSMSYSSTTAAAAATPNYGTNLMNELSPSWLKPSFPKQQQQHPNALHFSNNTPFWNTSAASMSDVGATFLTSSQSQLLVPTFEQKPNCPCPSLAKMNANNDEVRNLGSVAKKGSEPAIKRPRIETPSPLPTFKVRKEKLGDRITALQQLVSPFGKTDTASVLHEAIEYIKFLHDQVSVLSTPYMKNSNAIQHQQGVDKMKEADAGKKDLSSRGLCLVPISSTFPVANESSPDFWTPTLGGHFQVGRMS